MQILRQLLKHGLKLLLTLLLGGIFAATLVRVAPGFGMDEEQLDLRLNNQTLASFRNTQATTENLPAFYFDFAARLLHGDLGTSRTLEQPVRQLIADRLPETLKSVALALLLGW